jgi:hypothetical protein
MCRSLSPLTVMMLVAATAGPVPADDENITDLIQFEGTEEKLKALLAKHPELATRRLGRRGETPLQLAASQRRVAKVEILLAAGAKMDALSAAALGRFDELEAILKKEPWQAKAPNKTLHAAAERGDLRSVKLLLACGADPNLDYGFGNVLGPYTPLSSAVTRGHYEIAKLLLEHGAKTDVSAGKNYDSLYEFASSDKRFKELLLQYDPDLAETGVSRRAERRFPQRVTPPPIDRKALAEHLRKLLRDLPGLSASKRAELFAELEEIRGSEITDMIVDELPKLSDKSNQAMVREVLLKRLGRLKLASLAKCLEPDEARELRLAVLQTITKQADRYQDDLPRHADELISILNEADTELADLSLVALKALTKQDFARDKAKWKDWLKRTAKP